MLSPTCLMSAEYEDRDNSIRFSWTETDQICVYTTSATRIKFFIESLSPDARNATLTASGWALVPETQYYSYFPYNKSFHSAPVKPMTALPVSYTGQCQQENSSIGHLAAYDYMTSRLFTGSDACHINYNHVASIVRIECPMRSSESLESITLSTASNLFTTSATMDVTNNQLTPTEKASSVTLTLDGLSLARGQKLVAYLMMAPVNLSGIPVEVTVHTTDGRSARQVFFGPNVRAGKLYTIKMDVGFVNDAGSKQSSVDNRVLAKGNTIAVLDEENVNPATTVNIKYPTASAPDFILDAGNDFRDNVLLGDANGDGKVNTTDAVVVINYYLGKTNTIDIKAADINQDGKINTTDAVGIINKYLGK